MWKLRKLTRRRLITILSLIFVLGLTTTTALAARPRFSSAIAFSLGSLIAEGRLTGLGTQDVAVVLDATGIPVVTCTNQGGNQAPGQNPPKVSARGSQFLIHETYTKNGSTGFEVETNDPAPLSAKKMGCPNNTWTATIDFVFWTNATINVRADTETGAVLLHQDFVCVTTRSPASVSCTPIP
jgi:hypothetical protein